MKIIIVTIIFISGLIIINLRQKIKSLKNENQFLARLLYDDAINNNKDFYELEEDENGIIEDTFGKKYKMSKVKVDNKK